MYGYTYALLLFGAAILASVCCDQCDPGRFRTSDDSRCEICMTNCDKCKSKITCAECKVGYFLSSGTCLECPEHCNNCSSDGKCKCNEGFYQTYGECKACPRTCISCTSEALCDACHDGYFGINCYSTCPYNCKGGTCKKVSGECSECPEGLYGPTCSIPCSGNCLDGQCDVRGRCLGDCRSGYHGDKCDNACPKYCKDGNCTRNGSCKGGCEPGLRGSACDDPCVDRECVNYQCFQTNGTCIENCPRNCNSCSSRTQCSTCKHGFYGQACEYDCNTCKNNACSKDGCKFGCKSGHYSNGSECKRCGPNCTECDSSTTCTNCVNGRYGDRCELECTAINCKACTQHPTLCSTCKTGYKLINDTCCHANCVTCNGQGQCTSCIDGFFGVACQNKCMYSCKTCTTYKNCTMCRETRFNSKSRLETGLCRCSESQCKSSYHNNTCTQCLRPGFYAYKTGCCPCPDNCLQTERCDTFTGQCTNGCKDGWWGSLCDQPCPTQCVKCTTADKCTECKLGYYGAGCQLKCSTNCSGKPDQRICDEKTGHCLHSCADGKWGQTCEHTCGYGCVNNQCNSSSGHCLACKADRHGPFCSEDDGLIKIPVPVVVTVASVIIILIVTIIVIIRRQSSRQNRDIGGGGNEVDRNLELADIAGNAVAARGSLASRRSESLGRHDFTGNAMHGAFQPPEQCTHNGASDPIPPQNENMQDRAESEGYYNLNSVTGTSHSQYETLDAQSRQERTRSDGLYSSLGNTDPSLSLYERLEDQSRDEGMYSELQTDRATGGIGRAPYENMGQTSSQTN